MLPVLAIQSALHFHLSFTTFDDRTSTQSYSTIFAAWLPPERSVSTEILIPF